MESYQSNIKDGKDAARKGDMSRALQLFKRAYNILPSQKLEGRIKKIENLMAEVCEGSESEDEQYMDVSGLLLFRDMHNKLYVHQREGVAFLYNLYQDGKKGGILADDMGLGKTIQIIAFLSGMYDANLVKHTLLLMPMTLISNWTKEFDTWTPGLRVKVFHGSNQADRIKNLEKIQSQGGVLITTYQMLMSNWQLLGSYQGREFKWDYMILDEAHMIKNTSTKTAKSAYAIPAENRILLTGTPVQNNLREMWALFDFSCQGALLGTYRTFKSEYENPITLAREKDATPGEKALGSRMSENLMAIIQPYFLRRTKGEVQTEQSSKETNREECVDVNASHVASNPTIAGMAVMPKMTRKNDLIVWTYLSAIQEDLYRKFLSLDHIKYLNNIRSPLVELTVLKKLCDHPRLLSTAAGTQLGLKEETSENQLAAHYNNVCAAGTSSIDNIPDETLISESGKMVFLVELLTRLREEGHRTLVFARFLKILDIIQQVLANRGFKVLRLDGKVSQIAERDRLISTFQTDRCYSVLLLTTQVGGVGLNLTAADRVVIFDPSWNPATDNQAVDRAYRIGQTKNVVIYRLITCGTVEEKIYRRQVFKDSLIRQTTGDKKDPFRYFTKLELRELFILRETRSSSTQLQLQSLHSSHRKTDHELDEHITHLHSMDIFGISDHDLMFSQEVNCHNENLEDQESQRYIETRVQIARELMKTESERQSQLANTGSSMEALWLKHMGQDGGTAAKSKEKPKKKNPHPPAPSSLPTVDVDHNQSGPIEEEHDDGQNVSMQVIYQTLNEGVAENLAVEIVEDEKLSSIKYDSPRDVPFQSGPGEEEDGYGLDLNMQEIYKTLAESVTKNQAAEADHNYGQRLSMPEIPDESVAENQTVENETVETVDAYVHEIKYALVRQDASIVLLEETSPSLQNKKQSVLQISTVNVNEETSSKMTRGLDEQSMATQEKLLSQSHPLLEGRLDVDKSLSVGRENAELPSFTPPKKRKATVLLYESEGEEDAHSHKLTNSQFDYSVSPVLGAYNSTSRKSCEGNASGACGYSPIGSMIEETESEEEGDNEDTEENEGIDGEQNQNMQVIYRNLDEIVAENQAVQISEEEKGSEVNHDSSTDVLFQSGPVEEEHDGGKNLSMQVISGTLDEGVGENQAVGIVEDEELSEIRPDSSRDVPFQSRPVEEEHDYGIDPVMQVTDQTPDESVTKNQAVEILEDEKLPESKYDSPREASFDSRSAEVEHDYEQNLSMQEISQTLDETVAQNQAVEIVEDESEEEEDDHSHKLTNSQFDDSFPPVLGTSSSTPLKSRKSCEGNASVNSPRSLITFLIEDTESEVEEDNEETEENEDNDGKKNLNMQLMNRTLDESVAENQAVQISEEEKESEVNNDSSTDVLFQSGPVEEEHDGGKNLSMQVISGTLDEGVGENQAVGIVEDEELSEIRPDSSRDVPFQSRPVEEEHDYGIDPVMQVTDQTPDESVTKNQAVEILEDEKLPESKYDSPREASFDSRSAEVEHDYEQNLSMQEISQTLDETVAQNQAVEIVEDESEEEEDDHSHKLTNSQFDDSFPPVLGTSSSTPLKSRKSCEGNASVNSPRSLITFLIEDTESEVEEDNEETEENEDNDGKKNLNMQLMNRTLDESVAENQAVQISEEEKESEVNNDSSTDVLFQSCPVEEEHDGGKNLSMQVISETRDEGVGENQAVGIVEDEELSEIRPDSSRDVPFQSRPVEEEHDYGINPVMEVTDQTPDESVTKNQAVGILEDEKLPESKYDSPREASFDSRSAEVEHDYEQNLSMQEVSQTLDETVAQNQAVEIVEDESEEEEDDHSPKLTNSQFDDSFSPVLDSSSSTPLRSRKSCEGNASGACRYSPIGSMIEETESEEEGDNENTEENEGNDGEQNQNMQVISGTLDEGVGENQAVGIVEDEELSEIRPDSSRDVPFQSRPVEEEHDYGIDPVMQVTDQTPDESVTKNQAVEILEDEKLLESKYDSPREASFDSRSAEVEHDYEQNLSMQEIYQTLDETVAQNQAVEIVEDESEEEEDDHSHKLTNSQFDDSFPPVLGTSSSTPLKSRKSCEGNASVNSPRSLITFLIEDTESEVEEDNEETEENEDNDGKKNLNMQLMNRTLDESVAENQAVQISEEEKESEVNNDSSTDVLFQSCPVEEEHDGGKNLSMQVISETRDEGVGENQAVGIVEDEELSEIRPDSSRDVPFQSRPVEEEHDYGINPVMQVTDETPDESVTKNQAVGILEDEKLPESKYDSPREASFDSRSAEVEHDYEQNLSMQEVSQTLDETVAQNQAVEIVEDESEEEEDDHSPKLTNSQFDDSFSPVLDSSSSTPLRSRKSCEGNASGACRYSPIGSMIEETESEEEGDNENTEENEGNDGEQNQNMQVISGTLDEGVGENQAVGIVEDEELSEIRPDSSRDVPFQSRPVEEEHDYGINPVIQVTDQTPDESVTKNQAVGILEDEKLPESKYDSPKEASFDSRSAEVEHDYEQNLSMQEISQTPDETVTQNQAVEIVEDESEEEEDDHSHKLTNSQFDDSFPPVLGTSSSTPLRSRKSCEGNASVASPRSLITFLIEDTESEVDEDNEETEENGDNDGEKNLNMQLMNRTLDESVAENQVIEIAEEEKWSEVSHDSSTDVSFQSEEEHNGGQNLGIQVISGTLDEGVGENQDVGIVEDEELSDIKHDSPRDVPYQPRHVEEEHDYGLNPVMQVTDQTPDESVAENQAVKIVENGKVETVDASVQIMDTSVRKDASHVLLEETSLSLHNKKQSVLQIAEQKMATQEKLLSHPLLEGSLDVDESLSVGRENEELRHVSVNGSCVSEMDQSVYSFTTPKKRKATVLYESEEEEDDHMPKLTNSQFDDSFSPVLSSSGSTPLGSRKSCEGNASGACRYSPIGSMIEETESEEERDNENTEKNEGNDGEQNQNMQVISGTRDEGVGENQAVEISEEEKWSDVVHDSSTDVSFQSGPVEEKHNGGQNVSLQVISGTLDEGVGENQAVGIVEDEELSEIRPDSSRDVPFQSRPVEEEHDYGINPVMQVTDQTPDESVTKNQTVGILEDEKLPESKYDSPREASFDSRYAEVEHDYEQNLSMQEISQTLDETVAQNQAVEIVEDEYEEEEDDKSHKLTNSQFDDSFPPVLGTSSSTPLRSRKSCEGNASVASPRSLITFLIEDTESEVDEDNEETEENGDNDGEKNLNMQLMNRTLDESVAENQVIEIAEEEKWSEVNHDSSTDVSFQSEEEHNGGQNLGIQVISGTLDEGVGENQDVGIVEEEELSDIKHDSPRDVPYQPRHVEEEHDYGLNPVMQVTDQTPDESVAENQAVKIVENGKVETVDASVQIMDTSVRKDASHVLLEETSLSLHNKKQSVLQIAEQKMATQEKLLSHPLLEGSLDVDESLSVGRENEELRHVSVNGSCVSEMDQSVYSFTTPKKRKATVLYESEEEEDDHMPKLTNSQFDDSFSPVLSSSGSTPLGSRKSCEGNASGACRYSPIGSMIEETESEEERDNENTEKNEGNDGEQNQNMQVISGTRDEGVGENQAVEISEEEKWSEVVHDSSTDVSFQSGPVEEKHNGGQNVSLQVISGTLDEGVGENQAVGIVEDEELSEIRPDSSRDVPFQSRPVEEEHDYGINPVMQVTDQTPDESVTKNQAVGILEDEKLPESKYDSPREASFDSRSAEVEHDYEQNLSMQEISQTLDETVAQNQAVEIVEDEYEEEEDDKSHKLTNSQFDDSFPPVLGTSSSTPLKSRKSCEGNASVASPRSLTTFLIQDTESEVEEDNEETEENEDNDGEKNLNMQLMNRTLDESVAENQVIEIAEEEKWSEVNHDSSTDVSFQSEEEHNGGQNLGIQVISGTLDEGVGENQDVAMVEDEEPSDIKHDSPRDVPYQPRPVEEEHDYGLNPVMQVTDQTPDESVAENQAVKIVENGKVETVDASVQIMDTSVRKDASLVLLEETSLSLHNKKQSVLQIAEQKIATQEKLLSHPLLEGSLDVDESLSVGRENEELRHVSVIGSCVSEMDQSVYSFTTPKKRKATVLYESEEEEDDHMPKLTNSQFDDSFSPVLGSSSSTPLRSASGACGYSPIGSMIEETESEEEGDNENTAENEGNDGEQNQNMQVISGTRDEGVDESQAVGIVEDEELSEIRPDSSRDVPFQSRPVEEEHDYGINTVMQLTDQTPDESVTKNQAVGILEDEKLPESKYDSPREASFDSRSAEVEHDYEQNLSMQEISQTLDETVAQNQAVEIVEDECEEEEDDKSHKLTNSQFDDSFPPVLGTSSSTPLKSRKSCEGNASVVSPRSLTTFLIQDTESEVEEDNEETEENEDNDGEKNLNMQLMNRTLDESVAENQVIEIAEEEKWSEVNHDSSTDVSFQSEEEHNGGQNLGVQVISGTLDEGVGENQDVAMVEDEEPSHIKHDSPRDVPYQPRPVEEEHDYGLNPVMQVTDQTPDESVAENQAVKIVENGKVETVDASVQIMDTSVRKDASLVLLEETSLSLHNKKQSVLQIAEQKIAAQEKLLSHPLLEGSLDVDESLSVGRENEELRHVSVNGSCVSEMDKAVYSFTTPKKRKATVLYESEEEEDDHMPKLTNSQFDDSFSPVLGSSSSTPLRSASGACGYSPIGSMIEETESEEEGDNENTAENEGNDGEQNQNMQVISGTRDEGVDESQAVGIVEDEELSEIRPDSSRDVPFQSRPVEEEHDYGINTVMQLTDQTPDESVTKNQAVGILEDEKLPESKYDSPREASFDSRSAEVEHDYEQNLSMQEISQTLDETVAQNQAVEIVEDECEEEEDDKSHKLTNSQFDDSFPPVLGTSSSTPLKSRKSCEGNASVASPRSLTTFLIQDTESEVEEDNEETEENEDNDGEKNLNMQLMNRTLDESVAENQVIEIAEEEKWSEVNHDSSTDVSFQSEEEHNGGQNLGIQVISGTLDEGVGQNQDVGMVEDEEPSDIKHDSPRDVPYQPRPVEEEHDYGLNPVMQVTDQTPDESVAENQAVKIVENGKVETVDASVQIMDTSVRKDASLFLLEETSLSLHNKKQSVLQITEQKMATQEKLLSHPLLEGSLDVDESLSVGRENEELRHVSVNGSCVSEMDQSVYSFTTPKKRKATVLYESEEEEDDHMPKLTNSQFYDSFSPVLGSSSSTPLRSRKSCEGNASGACRYSPIGAMIEETESEEEGDNENTERSEGNDGEQNQNMHVIYRNLDESVPENQAVEISEEDKWSEADHDSSTDVSFRSGPVEEKHNGGQNLSMQVISGTLDEGVGENQAVGIVEDEELSEIRPDSSRDLPFQSRPVEEEHDYGINPVMQVTDQTPDESVTKNQAVGILEDEKLPESKYDSPREASFDSRSAEVEHDYEQSLSMQEISQTLDETVAQNQAVEIVEDESEEEEDDHSHKLTNSQLDSFSPVLGTSSSTPLKSRKSYEGNASVASPRSLITFLIEDTESEVEEDNEETEENEDNDGEKNLNMQLMNRTLDESVAENQVIEIAEEEKWSEVNHDSSTDVSFQSEEEHNGGQNLGIQVISGTQDEGVGENQDVGMVEDEELSDIKHDSPRDVPYLPRPVEEEHDYWLNPVMQVTDETPDESVAENQAVKLVENGKVETVDASVQIMDTSVRKDASLVLLEETSLSLHNKKQSVLQIDEQKIATQEKLLSHPLLEGSLEVDESLSVGRENEELRHVSVNGSCVSEMDQSVYSFTTPKKRKATVLYESEEEEDDHMPKLTNSQFDDSFSPVLGSSSSTPLRSRKSCEGNASGACRYSPIGSMTEETESEEEGDNENTAENEGNDGEQNQNMQVISGTRDEGVGENQTVGIVEDEELSEIRPDSSRDVPFQSRPVEEEHDYGINPVMQMTDQTPDESVTKNQAVGILEDEKLPESKYDSPREASFDSRSAEVEHDYEQNLSVQEISQTLDETVVKNQAVEIVEDESEEEEDDHSHKLTNSQVDDSFPPVLGTSSSTPLKSRKSCEGNASVASPRSLITFLIEDTESEVEEDNEETEENEDNDGNKNLNMQLMNRTLDESVAENQVIEIAEEEKWSEVNHDSSTDVSFQSEEEHNGGQNLGIQVISGTLDEGVGENQDVGMVEDEEPSDIKHDSPRDVPYQPRPVEEEHDYGLNPVMQVTDETPDESVAENQAVKMVENGKVETVDASVQIMDSSVRKDASLVLLEETSLSLHNKKQSVLQIDEQKIATQEKLLSHPLLEGSLEVDESLSVGRENEELRHVSVNGSCVSEMDQSVYSFTTPKKRKATVLYESEEEEDDHMPKLTNSQFDDSFSPVLGSSSSTPLRSRKSCEGNASGACRYSPIGSMTEETESEEEGDNENTAENEGNDGEQNQNMQVISGTRDEGVGENQTVGIVEDEELSEIRPDSSRDVPFQSRPVEEEHDYGINPVMQMTDQTPDESVTKNQAVGILEDEKLPESKYDSPREASFDSRSAEVEHDYEQNLSVQEIFQTLDETVVQNQAVEIVEDESEEEEDDHSHKLTNSQVDDSFPPVLGTSSSTPLKSRKSCEGNASVASPRSLITFLIEDTESEVEEDNEETEENEDNDGNKNLNMQLMNRTLDESVAENQVIEIAEEEKWSEVNHDSSTDVSFQSEEEHNGGQNLGIQVISGTLDEGVGENQDVGMVEDEEPSDIKHDSPRDVPYQPRPVEEEHDYGLNPVMQVTDQTPDESVAENQAVKMVENGKVETVDASVQIMDTSVRKDASLVLLEETSLSLHNKKQSVLQIAEQKMATQEKLLSHPLLEGSLDVDESLSVGRENEELRHVSVNGSCVSEMDQSVYSFTTPKKRKATVLYESEEEEDDHMPKRTNSQFNDSFSPVLGSSSSTPLRSRKRCDWNASVASPRSLIRFLIEDIESEVEEDNAETEENEDHDGEQNLNMQVIYQTLDESVAENQAVEISDEEKWSEVNHDSSRDVTFQSGPAEEEHDVGQNLSMQVISGTLDEGVGENQAVGIVEDEELSDIKPDSPRDVPLQSRPAEEEHDYGLNPVILVTDQTPDEGVTKNQAVGILEDEKLPQSKCNSPREASFHPRSAEVEHNYEQNLSMQEISQTLDVTVTQNQAVEIVEDEKQLQIKSVSARNASFSKVLSDVEAADASVQEVMDTSVRKDASLVLLDDRDLSHQNEKLSVLHMPAVSLNEETSSEMTRGLESLEHSGIQVEDMIHDMFTDDDIIDEQEMATQERMLLSYLQLDGSFDVDKALELSLTTPKKRKAAVLNEGEEDDHGDKLTNSPFDGSFSPVLGSSSSTPLRSRKRCKAHASVASPRSRIRFMIEDTESEVEEDNEEIEEKEDNDGVQNLNMQVINQTQDESAAENQAIEIAEEEKQSEVNHDSSTYMSFQSYPAEEEHDGSQTLSRQMISGTLDEGEHDLLRDVPGPVEEEHDSGLNPTMHGIDQSLAKNVTKSQAVGILEDETLAESKYDSPREASFHSRPVEVEHDYEQNMNMQEMHQTLDETVTQNQAIVEDDVTLRQQPPLFGRFCTHQ